MNKQELVKAVAEKLDLITAKKADTIVKRILESITDSLSKGKPVALIGFGTFSISKRKARNGRNPRTGELLKIPACKAVKFSAGKALKKAVNKSK